MAAFLTVDIHGKPGLNLRAGVRIANIVYILMYIYNMCILCTYIYKTIYNTYCCIIIYYIIYIIVLLIYNIQYIHSTYICTSIAEQCSFMSLKWNE